MIRMLYFGHREDPIGIWPYYPLDRIRESKKDLYFFLSGAWRK